MFKLMRLLLNAAPVEGGNGDVTPPAEPPPATPPATPPAADDAEAKLQEALREQAALTARIKALETESQSAAERARKEAQRQAAQQAGTLQEQVRQAQDALEAERRERQEFVGNLALDRRDAIVATALIGFTPVNEDAGVDAMAKLNGLIEHKVEGGKIVVQFKDGKPATPEALRAIVQGPAFAHFRKAGSTGGSGSTGTQLQGQNPEDANLSPSEKAFRAYGQLQAAVEPRFAGFGLKAVQKS